MSPFAFLRLPLFSSEAFLMSPFVFLRLPFFFIGCLSDEPLCVIWVASFFIGGLSDEPLCIFWVVSFFIGGLSDKPINEGSKSTPLFVALLVCTKVLVECQANLVSYFDLAPLWFLGNEVFIDASGYVGSRTLP
jgi:hypothetical protein